MQQKLYMTAATKTNLLYAQVKYTKQLQLTLIFYLILQTITIA